MIETQRLYLRPYVLSDYAAYLAMCSDPEVIKHLGGQQMSPEDAWNRILRYAGHWALFGHGLFAVIEKASGHFIGETGIADFHRGIGAGFDGAGEACWVFSSATHGQGYAFEAASAAHNWFAENEGECRTVCLIAPGNGRSLRLAARLGYTAFGETNYRGSTLVTLEKRPTHR